MPPVIRYAKSGDIHVAYQVFGEGPLNLVFVPLFVSNIEVYVGPTEWARWLLRLGNYSRVVMFDKRGTGVSDRIIKFRAWISASRSTGSHGRRRHAAGGATRYI